MSKQDKPIPWPTVVRYTGGSERTGVWVDHGDGCEVEYVKVPPVTEPVLTDEQIDDAIKACPLEGYGLLCEMPADMTGANFKKTVRQWTRAVLAAAQECKQ